VSSENNLSIAASRTVAPASAKQRAAVSSAEAVSGAACSHSYVRHTPTRGALTEDNFASAGRPVTAEASSATSATLRAMRPTVSSDSETGFTPWRLTRPKLGLYPTTPQNEDGRIVEPPVCVPIPSGIMKSATPAADPLDEPPGVCAVLCGLAVFAR